MEPDLDTSVGHGNTKQHLQKETHKVLTMDDILYAAADITTGQHEHA